MLAEKGSLDMDNVLINPRRSMGVPAGQTIGGAEVRISERDTLSPPVRCEECEKRDEVRACAEKDRRIATQAEAIAELTRRRDELESWHGDEKTWRVGAEQERTRYRDALSAVAYEVAHVRKLIGETRTAQGQAAHAVAALSRLSALCEAMGVS